MAQYSYLSNAEPSYIDELYKSYKRDPLSVDSEWQRFFEGFDFSLGSQKWCSSLRVAWRQLFHIRK